MATFTVSINVSKDQAQLLTAIVCQSVTEMTKKMHVGSTSWCDLKNLDEEVKAAVEDALKVCEK